MIRTCGSVANLFTVSLLLRPRTVGAVQACRDHNTFYIWAGKTRTYGDIVILFTVKLLNQLGKLPNFILF